MKQQATLLSTHGHQVRVLTGSGEASSESYEVLCLEALHPDFELNQTVKRAVDHGQTDAHFHEFTARLTELLKPHFSWADLVMDHGALTTPYNLSLTRAVWELGEAHPLVVWAHDFAPSNHSHALPLADHHPWSMLKTLHPSAHYVAVSRRRQSELNEILKVPVERLHRIEPTVDWQDAFGTDPWFLPRMEPWRLLDRDLVLYYPTKIMQRKKIDLAYEMTTAIRKSGLDALLVVSGAPDPYQPANHQYRSYIESLAPMMGLEEHSCLLAKVFQDPLVAWQQMFNFADVVLFTSGYEGFGLPAIEALLHRIPCWSTLDADVQGWPLSHVLKVSTPKEAVSAAESLMQDTVHVERRNCLRRQVPSFLYTKELLPMMQKVSASAR